MNKGLVSLFVAVSSLMGCDNRPAPSPTSNPHPQATLKLIIVVEKSGVNRVEVLSNWVVSNLGSAPINYPAGNRRVKQVDTSEQVDKAGDYYVATILMDRFLPDDCRWINGGPVIKFFHDDYLLSSEGINADVLRGERIDEGTCLTRPFSRVGSCGLRDSESYFKKEDKNAFNVAVELMK